MSPAGRLQVQARFRRDEFELDVELSSEPGESIGILGPNGSGKTTLLRLLAGLEALDSGRIELDGEPLDDAVNAILVPPERRPVGLVFQDYRLFPHLDVRDNVAFGPRSKGLRRRAARALATDWLDRLELGQFTDRMPGELSGGQAQRVALARALAAEPRLLLLDEPLAALDAQTRQQVRGELRRHLREFTGCTLIVTHDPVEAMVMTNRLIVLEHGRVVQQGRPSEIAQQPASQYVARLVGLNLYAGVLETDGRLLLDDGGALRTSGPAGVPSGTRVFAAIRPNALTLATHRPLGASPRNVWPATVQGLQVLTDRVRVQVGGERDALVDVTVAAVAELDLVEGSQVWVSAKATEIELYPGSP
jgi:molybdate transport system ATP-binding protein